MQMIKLPDNYSNILQENFMNTSNTSKNAISHGAYSTEAVLPWENEGEFNALHKAYVDELKPEGPDEEDLVFDLVCLRWKKRRLNLGSQLAYRRIKDASKLADAGRNGGWEGVADYLSSSVQDADSLRTSVHDIINMINAAVVSTTQCINKHIIKKLEVMHAPNTVPPSASGTPVAGATPASAGAQSGMPPSSSNQANQLSPDQLKDAVSLVRELQICSSQLLPALRLLEHLDETLCHKAYNPEVLERELKRHAMIDKQMEKTMQRLVMVKEYKKMYRPKLISASSPAGTTLLPR